MRQDGCCAGGGAVNKFCSYHLPRYGAVGFFFSSLDITQGTRRFVDGLRGLKATRNAAIRGSLPPAAAFSRQIAFRFSLSVVRSV